MHLLRDVPKFLRQNDTPPARFGREAVGDPRFVFDLRNGRDPRPRTIARVRTYLVMDRIAMSTAAAGLLRALIGRARAPRSRILLTNIRSVDWQSLTFSGERHHLELRVPGPNSGEIVERMCARLEEAEFSIPGILVADIAVTGEARRALDGSISVAIEALTLSGD